jgi:hypothetical protein
MMKDKGNPAFADVDAMLATSIQRTGICMRVRSSRQSESILTSVEIRTASECQDFGVQVSGKLKPKEAP